MVVIPKYVLFRRISSCFFLLILKLWQGVLIFWHLLAARVWVYVCRGRLCPVFCPRRETWVAGGRFAPSGERFGCYRRPTVFLTGGGEEGGQILNLKPRGSINPSWVYTIQYSGVRLKLNRTSKSRFTLYSILYWLSLFFCPFCQYLKNSSRNPKKDGHKGEVLTFYRL